MRHAIVMPRISGVAASNPAVRTSAALHNLRAVIILIVLAFHSMLAYLQWLPAGVGRFDAPPYAWRAFPIVDSHRFAGFDLFCAWQDVDLMALLFFLSGLFVWGSLERRGGWAFLRDRIMRLGLPYVFGIVVLMPIAIYPAYRVTAVDPSVGAYWNNLIALPFWPNGPLWFLWQLLALNIAAPAVHLIAPKALAALGRWSAAAGRHPWRYAAALLAASAVAYVPPAVVFTPWAWSNTGPFALQFSRPLLDAVYFFAGVGIGSVGIERGVLSADGMLARHWAPILAAALTTLFLWMGLTALTMNGGASLGVRIAADLSFVPACATGGCFLVAVCLRFAPEPVPGLGYLATNAYGLYLVHYIFSVWLQFALLDLPLFAVVKAAIVFAGTLSLSIATIVIVSRIPLGSRLIGTAPRAAVPS